MVKRDAHPRLLLVFLVDVEIWSSDPVLALKTAKQVICLIVRIWMLILNLIWKVPSVTNYTDLISLIMHTCEVTLQSELACELILYARWDEEAYKLGSLWNSDSIFVKLLDLNFCMIQVSKTIWRPVNWWKDRMPIPWMAIWRRGKMCEDTSGWLSIWSYPQLYQIPT